MLKRQLPPVSGQPPLRVMDDKEVRCEVIDDCAFRKPHASTPSAPTVRNDDDARWEAVRRRVRVQDGQFFYAVLTTGTYCRPGCPSRLPLRDNVRFFDTVTAAERAGFRACLRCWSNGISIEERRASLILNACSILKKAQRYSLTELSVSLGVSRYHLHRIFKATTGLTPMQYMRAKRTEYSALKQPKTAKDVATRN
jgi:AraC family transcriptional regulator of adaptative response/methylated-DNA-[protein]-cysteine methyltransferase